MISFYVLPKRLLLKDVRVVSLTKKEYGFAVHFLERFVKYLNQYLTNN